MNKERLKALAENSSGYSDSETRELARRVVQLENLIRNEVADRLDQIVYDAFKNASPLWVEGMRGQKKLSCELWVE